MEVVVADIGNVGMCIAVPDCRVQQLVGSEDQFSLTSFGVHCLKQAVQGGTFASSSSTIGRDYRTLSYLGFR